MSFLSGRENMMGLFYRKSVGYQRLGRRHHIGWRQGSAEFANHELNMLMMRDHGWPVGLGLKPVYQVMCAAVGLLLQSDHGELGDPCHSREASLGFSQEMIKFIVPCACEVLLMMLWSTLAS